MIFADAVAAAAHIPQLWYALPLIVAVSLVYSATRHEHIGPILYHSVRLGVWIGVFMGLVAVVLFWLGRGL